MKNLAGKFSYTKGHIYTNFLEEWLKLGPLVFLQLTKNVMQIRFSTNLILLKRFSTTVSMETVALIMERDKSLRI